MFTLHVVNIQKVVDVFCSTQLNLRLVTCEKTKKDKTRLISIESQPKKVVVVVVFNKRKLLVFLLLLLLLVLT